MFVHRWLGIAGCLLFAAWFASGIVMMYARMPELAAEERLARLAPLDLSGVTITPSAAADTAGVGAGDLELVMFRGRPAYKSASGARSPRASATVFADTGEWLDGTTADDARRMARLYEPDYAGAFHDDGYLTEPDQWTLQARGLPMYRFALDDARATRLYVSAVSGEVVLRTTRAERFWGYLGPVVHWLYFTPLRRNGPLWTQLIIWSSLAGCLLCATGLIWGVMRFSLFRRYRAGNNLSYSPYVGWMKWHHVSGLIFGVAASTWVYSGLLSMEPFNWFQPVGRGVRGSRAVLASPSTEAATLESLRLAHATFGRDAPVRTLRLVAVRGEQFWMTESLPASSRADDWRSPSLWPRTPRARTERRYVSVGHPEGGVFTSFSQDVLERVAQAEMSDVPIASTAWLDHYDGYYYDPSGTRALPVLRLQYSDPQQTWLYLDPRTGAVVQRSESATRLRRWLYQGLHSLDFPGFYFRRPLWDLVVISLSIGGVVVSVAAMWPGARRLARHLAPAVRWWG